MRTISNPRIHGQVKSLTALGLIYFLILLPSCGSKQLPMPVARQQVQKIILTDDEIARFHDIYFPEDACPEKLVAQPGETILSFISCVCTKDLIDAYKTHMEYGGWHLVVVFPGVESCLVFEKPTKRCVVTLRPKSESTCVVLFMGPKSLES